MNERERGRVSKEKFLNQLSKDESGENSCETKNKIHENFFSKRPHLEKIGFGSMLLIQSKFEADIFRVPKDTLNFKMLNQVK